MSETDDELITQTQNALDGLGSHVTTMISESPDSHIASRLIRAVADAMVEASQMGGQAVFETKPAQPDTPAPSLQRAQRKGRGVNTSRDEGGTAQKSASGRAACAVPASAEPTSGAGTGAHARPLRSCTPAFAHYGEDSGLHHRVPAPRTHCMLPARDRVTHHCMSVCV